jgi:D-alanyl-D-alanine carboxypeptidase (penicillin-binding protein 5/6)
MHVVPLAAVTAEPTAVVPVAGLVRNTNALLGRDGIVGLKTGSTQAAGGCLLVAAWQQVSGHNILIVAATLARRWFTDLLGWAPFTGASASAPRASPGARLAAGRHPVLAPDLDEHVMAALHG